MIKARAISSKVMRGDTTVMEKNISYPTNSGLRKTSWMRVQKLVWKAKNLGVTSSKTFRTFA